MTVAAACTGANPCNACKELLVLQALRARRRDVRRVPEEDDHRSGDAMNVADLIACEDERTSAR